MPYGRRLLVLLILVTAVAIPAVALRAACAGESCREESAAAKVPFCPLPDDLKARIAAGFREGRSPDVLAVTREARLWGGAGNAAPDWAPADAAWPSVSGGPSTAVPIVFSGVGVEASSTLPSGTGLDAIATTIADILGFRRPHPEVRSGRAVPGVASGEQPRLILEVAWKGIGSEDLAADPGAWPFLRSLLRSGTGTLEGDTGSVPLDAAATLTTIGTGGLPSQHGITGTLLRNEQGELAAAWGDEAPLSVIATLADDLDESMDQRPLIGLGASDVADRGIVGGNWYVPHDRDEIDTGANPRSAALDMLASGFGDDEVPDVLAVVMEGSVGRLDDALRRLVTEAGVAANGSLAVVVAATGSTTGSVARQGQVSRMIRTVEARVRGATGPLVEAATPGGLFLDQQRLAADGISGSQIVDALLGLRAEGTGLMVDAFQGFAVSFARYC